MNDTRLIVPSLDEVTWPTLGPEVCDWMEARLCHGPGDILGRPATLTDEFRLIVYRAYEIYPRGHRLAGRRRFKRVTISRRKGVAKTEWLAWLGLAELDPECPVRFDGWRRQGKVWVPVGRPVHDPYIPMVSTGLEQTEELAYGAAVAILEHCPLGDDYDVGLERIMHRREPGKMQAMASAPKAADGRRTTFQGFDETHLYVDPRLIATHEVMLRNVVKRKLSDAWSAEATTMYAPGEGSIAERSHLRAEAIRRGDVVDPTLMFDHRQASMRWDLTKRRELFSAIEEASGDAWPYTDAEAIAGLLVDHETDGPDFRRYFLNQPSGSAKRMFSALRWAELVDEERSVGRDSEIVLFFDGSYARDSTGVVGVTVEEKPHVFVVAAWEAPYGDPDWRTPRIEVDGALEEAMDDYRVLELACDPPGWHHEVEQWAERWGSVVTKFDTWKTTLMGPASDEAVQALKDGDFTHDGDERLARHVANCVPSKRGKHVVPTKDRSDSPRKIDLAVGWIGGLARSRWNHVNGASEPWVDRW